MELVFELEDGEIVVAPADAPRPLFGLTGTILGAKRPEEDLRQWLRDNGINVEAVCECCGEQDHGPS